MGKLRSTRSPEEPCSFPPRTDARIRRLLRAKGGQKWSREARGGRFFALVVMEARQARRPLPYSVVRHPRIEFGVNERFKGAVTSTHSGPVEVAPALPSESARA